MYSKWLKFLGIAFRVRKVPGPRGLFLESPRNVSGPKSHFKNHEAFYVQSFLMSTGFAFKQRLHLCSVSNLRIFLVFQLRTFRAQKCSGAFEKRAPGHRNSKERSRHVDKIYFATDAKSIHENDCKLQYLWTLLYRFSTIPNSTSSIENC